MDPEIEMLKSVEVINASLQGMWKSMNNPGSMPESMNIPGVGGPVRTDKRYKAPKNIVQLRRVAEAERRVAEAWRRVAEAECRVAEAERRAAEDGDGNETDETEDAADNPNNGGPVVEIVD